MQFLFRWFDRWASRRQKREIEDFIARLRGMSGEELGFVLGGVEAMRVDALQDRYDFLHPIELVMAQPGFTYELSCQVIRLQRAGKPLAAAPLLVWVHTLRAAARLELRYLGQEMWTHLARGFAHMEGAGRGLRVPEGMESPR